MAEIYGNGLALSEKLLDNLWMRQNVTQNNIANVDTPGFKAQYVSFEEELASRLSGVRRSAGGQFGAAAREALAKAISGSSPGLYRTSNQSTRLDGNTVDMDQEQVDLVRTALEYQHVLGSVNNDINRLRTAVKNF